MQPVLTSEQMRWCDEQTIAGGVPGLLLMENAGRSVVDLLHEEFGSLAGAHVAVVCGKGNNGGDGFVIARHLSASAACVTVLLAAAPASYRGDAKANLQMLQRLSRDGRNQILLKRATPAALRECSDPDLIIDALFGTGFAGEIQAAGSSLIAWMNQQTAAVVAVDIPSGVDGTTGRAGAIAVDASLTVTFGFVKSGLLLNDGREAAGRVYISDIGIPPAVVARGAFSTMLVDAADVQPLLPKRPFNAHKYSVGKVLLIAGSRGYTGAASLCATSALRSGAGAVMLLTPDAVYPILAKKLTEAIVRPLPSNAEGSLAADAVTHVREHLDWADVVVLGPGLSRNEDIAAIVKELLLHFRGNLLLDADALWAVASVGPSILRKSKATMILTPHAGEFARLTGAAVEECESRRIEVVKTFAADSHTNVVLKGMPTAAASPEGTVVLNSTGNPGMATVGSGDVLAGIIAGFWAQGMSPYDAAWCGAFVHGLAGDAAAESRGERSLVAGDLIEYLPEALRRIEIGDSA